MQPEDMIKMVADAMQKDHLKQVGQSMMVVFSSRESIVQKVQNDAKLHAMRSRVDYDTFKQMVQGLVGCAAQPMHV